VFGATGGQSVNTTDSSVIQTDFSQSGLSAIDADEGVDPVAEADVYMAYGRDAQAEEILLDALKTDPSRLAIYLKLLEIYAQRKSLKQFETTATDLYSRTGGDGTEWTKAAELGRKIDPENPLYRATAGESGVVSASRPAESKGGDGGASTAALGGAAGVAAAAALGAGNSVKQDSTTSTDGEMIDLDFGTNGSGADVGNTAVAPVGSNSSDLKDTWAMPGDLGEVSRVLDGGFNEDVSDGVNAAAKP
jgi:pilus assembly protein FimV